jgi:hypothetical protein
MIEWQGLSFKNRGLHYLKLSLAQNQVLSNPSFHISFKNASLALETNKNFKLTFLNAKERHQKVLRYLDDGQESRGWMRWDSCYRCDGAKAVKMCPGWKERGVPGLRKSRLLKTYQ